MIDWISAIGSIGTFIMATIYFISVSIQIFQMRISYMPSIGYNQTILEKVDGELKLKNANEDNPQRFVDYIKLSNMGGGAARNVSISMYIDGENELQNKYLNILPSNDAYLLPINQGVYEELEHALKNQFYKTKLRVRIDYNNYLSKKTKTVDFNARIDNFFSFNDKEIYELQFIQGEDHTY